MSRAERHAEATRLIAAGHSSRYVGEIVGVSYSYVRELISDPDGSKVRARKASYAGECIDCGGPTDGSNGRTGQPMRCHPCRKDHERAGATWTREAIVERIKAWVDLYGEIPSATDWNPNQAHAIGRGDIADRFYADGCWPFTSRVVARFGRWNAGIEAAGFIPRFTRGAPRPQAVALAAVDL